VKEEVERRVIGLVITGAGKKVWDGIEMQDRGGLQDRCPVEPWAKGV